MSISFFIVGGVIFTIYLFLMFWNIVYSNKKQKEKNYPNIDNKEVLNKNNNL
jgi:phosphotransferase system  glucose/maltose/N-acetylglucosamine-specific IIC component